MIDLGSFDLSDGPAAGKAVCEEGIDEFQLLLIRTGSLWFLNKKKEYVYE